MSWVECVGTFITSVERERVDTGSQFESFAGQRTVWIITYRHITCAGKEDDDDDGLLSCRQWPVVTFNMRSRHANCRSMTQPLDGKQESAAAIFIFYCSSPKLRIRRFPFCLNIHNNRSTTAIWFAYANKQGEYRSSTASAYCCVSLFSSVDFTIIAVCLHSMRNQRIYTEIWSVGRSERRWPLISSTL